MRQGDRDAIRHARRPDEGLQEIEAHPDGRCRRQVNFKHKGRREPQGSQGSQGSQGRTLCDPCGSLRPLCLDTRLPPAPATPEECALTADPCL